MLYLQTEADLWCVRNSPWLFQAEERIPLRYHHGRPEWLT